ncbi:citrate synthase family protein [Candidimonas nitroreducens]|uniref:citrate/2-methylcitrate synthase n=1 Tax=Candidimonas nitroreducens TaxID=683354 RepID=UPI0011781485|nr:citrate/2-methylcitrate synthase [Candidimonas nitroreducens]
MARRKQLRTDIGWSTEDKITIKGLDLCRDIMGKVSLGDMAFLELTDRLPSPRESRMFNALTVILVEHGMTPSAIATRMLQEAVPDPSAAPDVEALAHRVVAELIKGGRSIPGIGHHIHKPVDPRAK